MKKLSILTILFAGLVAMSSCDKGELGPVMSSEPSSPSITSPESGQSYTLSQDQAEDTLLTMEWEEPDYGFTSAPQYIVQMDDSGNEFADPTDLVTTQETSYSITVGDMNNRLLSAGYAADQSVSLDFRVVAALQDSIGEALSEPISLSFTPYLVEVNYPEIYVPGGYQASSGYTADWSPADAPALYSVNSDDTYEGYVYMANADNQFKFTDERTWDLNWGDDGADGTLDQDGANIVASTAGYYKMNVNLNDMTYTTVNTSWGVIGSATADDWNSDQDMTYDPATKVWTATLDLTAEEIKFRANDAWDIEYGDTGADGNLDAGGDNIVVPEAGNYTITLNLSEAPYTYSLTKN